MALISTAYKVNEGSSCRISFTLQDYDGTAIADTNISAATFTLKNKDDGVVINSRSAVDVKSYFNGSGEFSMLLNATDNAIQETASTKAHETHVASFSITATVATAAFTLKEEIWINVVRLEFT